MICAFQKGVLLQKTLIHIPLRIGTFLGSYIYADSLRVYTSLQNIH